MATKPSKFRGIFEPTEEPVPEETPAQPSAAAAAPTSLPALPAAIRESTPEEGSERSRRTGRPASGKKSDPNYRQVTAYVRKDLYRDVTDALYDEVRGRDAKRKEFSELVDELLARWWQERNGREDRTG